MLPSPLIRHEALPRHCPADRDHGGAAHARTPAARGIWSRISQTIAPYTIEEAYEVADAIGRGDLDDLKDELGDLLLQVVFHARMAEEQGSFAFGDVVQAITEKLIRRHPHVFGDKGGMSTGEVNVQWDQIKAEKRSQEGRTGKSRQGPCPCTLAAPARSPASRPDCRRSRAR